MKLHYHCCAFGKMWFYVVSELDQHTADFKGGSFPLSLVSSYNSCSKKKGESGAWRKVSTSPRKKSSRFSSPTWNKPDLSEEGKWVGTHDLVSEGKYAFIFITVHSTKQNAEYFNASFHGINQVHSRQFPKIFGSPHPKK